MTANVIIDQLLHESGFCYILKQIKLWLVCYLLSSAESSQQGVNLLPAVMLLEVLQQYKGNPLTQQGCTKQPWQLSSYSVAQMHLTDLLWQPRWAVCITL